jgi:hypothetical protein
VTRRLEIRADRVFSLLLGEENNGRGLPGGLALRAAIQEGPEVVLRRTLNMYLDSGDTARILARMASDPRYRPALEAALAEVEPGQADGGNSAVRKVQNVLRGKP